MATININLIVSLLLLNILVSGTRISQKKCAEYREMFPTQYHEGEDAVSKEFPFMAKISNTTRYLNGILINENFVLSLAYFNSSDPTVVLGKLELFTHNDSAQSKTYKVINTFTHPDFKEGNAFADIKLYQLNESIKFNEYVRPACFSLNDMSFSENLTQISFGKTNIRNNNILHKLPLNYISDTLCKNVYKMAGRQQFVEDIDKRTIFCTESRSNRRIINNLGGALIYDNRNATDEVIGLSADRQTSGETIVTVIIRISPYVDWIESIVWPNHSSSITTPSANKIGKMTFPMKFIYLIIAAILMTLMLCASIVYFLLFKSKAGIRR